MYFDIAMGISRRFTSFVMCEFVVFECATEFPMVEAVPVGLLA